MDLSKYEQEKTMPEAETLVTKLIRTEFEGVTPTWHTAKLGDLEGRFATVAKDKTITTYMAMQGKIFYKERGKRGSLWKCYTCSEPVIALYHHSDFVEIIFDFFFLGPLILFFADYFRTQVLENGTMVSDAAPYCPNCKH